MDSVGMDGIWQLAEVIDKAASKNVTNNATLQATVTRVDNEGTAWVHIPGGAEETPINGLNTAEVQPGDVVGVSIAGNQASITGNATAPSVSQRTIQAAVAPVQRQAEEAKKQAEIAEKIASEVEAVSGDTNNHFWDDSNGAHVTDVEKDDWNTAVANNFADYDATNKPYHNLLLGRLGILLRTCLNNLVSITKSAIAFFDGNGNNAENIVASFGSDGVRIGKLADTHVTADSDSLDIMDGETVLSTFTDNGASLGANSQTANIDFCAGKGVIAANLYGEGDRSLNMVSSGLTFHAIKPKDDGSYFDDDGYILDTGYMKFNSGETAENTIANHSTLSIADKAWNEADKYIHGQVSTYQTAEGTTDNGMNVVDTAWGVNANYTNMPTSGSATVKRASLNLGANEDASNVFGYADDAITLQAHDNTFTLDKGRAATLELYQESDDRTALYEFNLGDLVMTYTYADGTVLKFMYTGAGNIRLDKNGAIDSYFVKYPQDNSRTRLSQRGTTVWQTSGGNVHLANGTTDSNSTWEYSFESAGIYIRTKSGSTWSSWKKITS